MSHRYSALQARDGRAFPVRIKVKVPVQADCSEPSLISSWLRNRIGRGEYAEHTMETPFGEVMVFHFRRVEDAFAFVTAFPELELADTTVAQTQTPAFLPKTDSGAKWTLVEG